MSAASLLAVYRQHAANVLMLGLLFATQATSSIRNEAESQHTVLDRMVSSSAQP